MAVPPAAVTGNAVDPTLQVKHAYHREDIRGKAWQPTPTMGQVHISQLGKQLAKFHYKALGLFGGKAGAFMLQAGMRLAINRK